MIVERTSSWIWSFRGQAGVVSSTPIRTTRSARRDGWRVDRVDTVPMTSEEYTSAVNALAVLVTALAQKVHDKRER